MEKRTKGCKLLLAAAVLFALGGSFNFIGCSSDSDSGSPTSQNSEVETTIGAITISASAATANEDGTYSVVLTATPNADDTDATDITYVWSLGDDASNVTLGSSSSSTVTATISAKPASATVTVTASATGATSVSATYSLSVGYDYTIGALTITASDNDDGSKAISVSADSTATTASDVTIAITLAETVDGLTLTDNGDGTATITNANDTDTTATVVATATATGAASVTAQAEVTVAKAGTTYLYSIGKLTATVGNVSGNTRVVTVTAAETDNAPETITYAYSVDDEEFAVSESSNTTGSVTLTNNSTTTKAVTLTVTATADESTSNSTTANVTVPANETLTISGVTLSATSGSAEQGESVTVTVSGGTVTSSDTARDAELSGELPEVTYAWSTDYSGISFDDSTASEVTITAASTASTGTATITVTASAEGATSASATYELTVVKAYPYTVYSQDFEDVTDITTVVATNTTNMFPTIELGTDNTDYAKVAFNTSNVRGQVATIATGLPSTLTADYKVDFDIKLSGPNAVSASAKQAAQFVLGNSSISLTSNAGYTGDYLLALYNYASGTGTAIENHPNAQQNNLWALSLDDSGEEITLDRTLWYHFTIVVDEDSKVTATITGSDGSTVIENKEIAATSTAFTNINMLLGRAAGNYYLDNFVVKTTKDVVAITEAASISGESEIANNGTATLTASAVAAYAAAKTSVTPTYTWEISDSTYASLSATEGATVTVTGKNDTINDKTVTLTVTAKAGDATSTATYSVKVLAKQDLLSDMTISATGSATSVAAGDTLALTLDGGTKDASLTDDETAVTYAWASSDTTIATVAATDTGATVRGEKEAADAVTITVTATLGSIKKTATYEVTVTESAATLSTLTLSATSGTVAKGFTTTFTAGANDSITPDSWKVTSSSENATVTYAADGSVCTVTITGVTAADSAITITVTAKKGDATATATYAVTVKEPVKNTLYSQDFDSVEDATTVAKSPSYAAGLSIENSITGVDGSTSSYLRYNDAGENGRNAYTTEDWKAPSSGSYYVELDFTVRPSNSGGKTSQFAVVDASTTPTNNAVLSSGYLFALTDSVGGGFTSSATTAYEWTVNGSTTTTVSLLGDTFYHLLLSVDIDNESITAVITDSSNNEVFNDSLVPTGTYVAGKVNMFCGRYYGVDSLDNVVVYNYQ